MMSYTQPGINTLKRLRPLAQFNEEQLQQLANQLQVEEARKGDSLLELGSMEEFFLFVLEGEIKLVARDGKAREQRIDAREELLPIAQLRPAMYEVRALGQLQYLKINNHLLTEFAQQSEEGVDDISVHMIEGDAQTNALTVHLYQDLIEDKITLPSLPEIAHKIQQVFQDENLDAERVAQLLLTDPAMTGKLIKVANSALYKGASSIDTLQNAIVRLGMDTTYKLVMAYALNDLFKAKIPFVAERMRELSAHSRKVAALSRLLARQTQGFDPEQAMLAGLIHDLGIIVILDYMERHSDDSCTPAAMGT